MSLDDDQRAARSNGPVVRAENKGGLLYVLIDRPNGGLYRLEPVGGSSQR